MRQQDKIHTARTAAQVARYSKDWILRLCHAGRIPHLRAVNGQFLIPDSALREFLKHHKRQRIVPGTNPGIQIVVRTTKG